MSSLHGDGVDPVEFLAENNSRSGVSFRGSWPETRTQEASSAAVACPRSVPRRSSLPNAEQRPRCESAQPPKKRQGPRSQ